MTNLPRGLSAPAKIAVEVDIKAHALFDPSGIASGVRNRTPLDEVEARSIADADGVVRIALLVDIAEYERAGAEDAAEQFDLVHTYALLFGLSASASIEILATVGSNHVVVYTANMDEVLEQERARDRAELASAGQAEQPAPSPYPECEKLSALSDETSTLYGFIESSGYVLASWVDTDSSGFHHKLAPVSLSATAIVHKYFGIDEDRLEAERRQMLRSLSQEG